MKRTFDLIILLFFSLSAAAQQPSPTKPINRVELVASLLSRTNHARLINSLEQRGIDFQPSDAFLKSLHAAGADDAILKAVREAKQIAPARNDHTVANEDAVLQHFLQAGKLEQERFSSEGADQKATEELQAALQLDPDDPYIHLSLGRLLVWMKQGNAAIKEFRQAIDLQTDLAEAHLGLGDELELAGNLDEAAKEYREVLRLEPRNAAAHVGLGNVLWKEGKQQEADQEFRTASQLPIDVGTPKRIRLGGQIMRERLLIHLNPSYSAEAKDRRLQGTVKLAVLVGRDGRVEDVKVVSGVETLAEAAVAAVSGWRYRPILLNGGTVEILTEVDVNFSLSR